MIVPEFWAEARIQRRFPGRQITVRRFGWSNESQEAAETHANERCEDAFNRILNGEELPRRERKVRYNGADGHPIREEILDRVGENVVTRNSYGARCLNSPNVLFLDIDFPQHPKGTCLAGIVGAVISSGFSLWLCRDLPIDAKYVLVLLTVVTIVSAILSMAIQSWIYKLLYPQKWHLKHGLANIRTAFERRPNWHVRVYRSPNGLRLLGMHETFDPRSEEVESLFVELNVDPLYRIMCQKQNCFRARLTAKPWRIGIMERFGPRPGVHPVNPVYHPVRKAWLAEYESSAKNYSAVHFMFDLGSTHISTPETQAVMKYHDRVCNADVKLGYDLA